MAKNNYLSIVLVLFLLIAGSATVYAQQPSIRSMEWGANLKISLELSNDSTYLLDVDQLPHSNRQYGQSSDQYTYYPVRLSEDFIAQLKEIPITEPDSTGVEESSMAANKTLWSALHNLIGGGWPHFINTLLYALEQGYLDLQAPLMERPQTGWKPSPMTESYRRTRKWDYYVPVNQRHAHKEYKRRKADGQLAEIRDVPDDFLRLFRETGNWKYKRMIKKEERKQLARIDLVKLLLGSYYLGKPQIQYVKTMVLKAVNDYSKDHLPSVIIFDNFNAAVAMSLNETGYRVDKIVFSDAKRIARQTKIERREKINAIVDNINEVNKKLFRSRLQSHYQ
jgi:hypothetical protein